MKKLLFDKFLKSEPKSDPEWVRTVHAIRASIGGKKTSDEDVKKIMTDRNLKTNLVYV